MRAAATALLVFFTSAQLAVKPNFAAAAARTRDGMIVASK